MLAFIIVCGVFALGVGIWSLWFTSPKQIGIRGEKKVNKILHELDGEVFENYILRDELGKTHQIDHILVNDKGVFVIETKNYSGRIYGNDSQKEWTQVLKYGKVKNHFLSPIKQNQGHCYQINHILPKGIKIVSVVVFVRNNTQYIKSDDVINLKKLKRRIEKEKPCLDILQKQEAIKALNEHKELNVTNKQHVKSIKQTGKEIKNNICPRCGGELVLRHGKNGDFYGCSNYPKCRYIKKD